MQKKTFLVTNGSEGSISLVGRVRIEIPGNCKDHRISLSAEKARAIVSRLKRTYPLLKIVEAPAPETKDAAVSASAPEATGDSPQGEQSQQAPAATADSPQEEQGQQPKTRQTPASAPEAGGVQSSAKKK